MFCVLENDGSINQINEDLSEVVVFDIIGTQYCCHTVAHCGYFDVIMIYNPLMIDNSPAQLCCGHYFGRAIIVKSGVVDGEYHSICLEEAKKYIEI